MFSITAEPIEPCSLNSVVRPMDGGLAAFLGIVRERGRNDKAVRTLSYQAYEPMARREFAEIAGEARQRFGDVAIGIVHRVGDLEVGEVAVAVTAAAPHRDAALNACRYVIDEIKRRAPIWKQEHYVDGTAQWSANP